MSDCPWLEIGVEGFTGELEGRVFSLNLSLSLSLCHTHIATQRQEHTTYTYTHKYTRLLENTHSTQKISLHAHAHPAMMIKVLCRRDSEWYCAVAACFPSWIHATSTAFSNGEETRHHKCKIRSNYVVICHMKYISVLQEWDSLCFKLFHTARLLFFAGIYLNLLFVFLVWGMQWSMLLFANVLGVCNVPLPLSSSPTGMGDQCCYSVDQWFWSGEIIGIAEISMRWWMIDNATTAINQWDIADKTPAVQPCMVTEVYQLIFMYSMNQINIAKQT